MFARRRIAQSVSRAFKYSSWAEGSQAGKARSVVDSVADPGAAYNARKALVGKFSLGLAAASLLTMAEAPTAACNGAPNQTASDAAPQNLAASDKKYKVVFVLGGPGSGKGTQSERLVEEFGLVHLSAGDLLRAHMKSGSPDGQMVANMIANGQIVPSHVTISLLQKAMDESGKLNILIDGFPRNEENRSAFEQQTGISPQFILFFDCPEAVMEKRLLGRNQGRTDDNIETIRKRFRVFVESSMPIIEHYEKLGKVRQINADRDPEEIYQQVRQLFADF